MRDLKNKNIIVTGASGGIGNSIIKSLYEHETNLLATGTKVEKLEELKSKFVNSINKYLPHISEDMLSPSYAGLRPITSKEERIKRDFTISTVENHQIENLINLYGIESPGLTSSLAIARYVAERL